MFFIENENGEKVATGSAFYNIYNGDDGVNGWLHWVAMRKEEQGRAGVSPAVWKDGAVRQRADTQSRHQQKTCAAILLPGTVPEPSEADSLGVFEILFQGNPRSEG
jgi:hypothetical protein